MTLLACVACQPGNRASDRVEGVNRRLVHLVRPAGKPLSAAARLGRDLFFDPSLSATRQLSCASCHSPAHAYGPSDSLAVARGGRSGREQGVRAIPSLRYVDRTPMFSIGPEVGASDEAGTMPNAPPAGAAMRAVKRAGVRSTVPATVPRGGLFWDGRASTLQEQAMSPLLNPLEMANPDIVALAARMRREYGARLESLFGREAIATPERLVAEALFTIARFEIEDPSFHPYSSKYDAWLEGAATLSPSEARGLRLFEDPAKGNCAACHTDRPGPGGQPPMFTDYEYEALGVPRNDSLESNARRDWYDLGLCGPLRTDLSANAQYCGMFRTPSLRNVAIRPAFFHNGRYHTLAEVLAFYDFRETHPERVYPPKRNGDVARYDDIPPAFRANVDVIDPPFNRRPADGPALSDGEMRDIIAFLGTLTDGYRPSHQR